MVRLPELDHSLTNRQDVKFVRVWTRENELLMMIIRGGQPTASAKAPAASDGAPAVDPVRAAAEFAAEVAAGRARPSAPSEPGLTLVSPAPGRSRRTHLGAPIEAGLAREAS